MSIAYLQPDRTTPRAGEFVTKDGGNQVVNTLSAASIIHIAPEDREGNSIAVDRITAGDVMRLSDISGVTVEVKFDNLAVALMQWRSCLVTQTGPLRPPTTTCSVRLTRRVCDG